MNNGKSVTQRRRETEKQRKTKDLTQRRKGAETQRKTEKESKSLPQRRRGTKLQRKTKDLTQRREGAETQRKAEKKRKSLTQSRRETEGQRKDKTHTGFKPPFFSPFSGLVLSATGHLSVWRGKLAFLACSLVLAAYPLYAQETPAAPTPQINAEVSDVVNAFFRASTDAPLIGEPFEIVLTVETPPGVDLVGFPAFPADSKIFEVLSQGEMQMTTAPSGAKTYSQKMTLVIWETGLHLTPEIAATFNQGGAVSNNLVKSASFNVPSVLDPSVEPALYPSLRPVDLPYVPPWIAAVVIFVLSILVYLLRVVILPRRRMGADYRPTGTPAQIAIAELEDLKGQQLAAALIYPMVADKMRQYLQVRFGIGAVEMTTGELMETLRNTGLSDTLRKSLRQVLEQADLVKFARFEPDAGATARLVNFAIKWLKDADSAAVPGAA